MPEGSSESKQSSAARMKRYRERMRARGLRPVVLWVPDTASPQFLREAERQSKIVAASDDEHEVMAWIDAVRDTTGWE